MKPSTKRMREPVAKPSALRYAVYTPVSTEHGLEQAFNAPDNPREAAEAGIESQAHEGWRCLPARLRRWMLGWVARTPGPAAADR